MDSKEVFHARLASSVAFWNQRLPWASRFKAKGLWADLTLHGRWLGGGHLPGGAGCGDLLRAAWLPKAFQGHGRGSWPPAMRTRPSAA